FKIAHPDTGAVLISLSAGSGLTLTASGVIQITLTETQMALPARPLPYDLIHLPAGGGMEPIATGYFVPEETVGYTLTGDIVPTTDLIALQPLAVPLSGETVATMRGGFIDFDADTDEYVNFS